ncbi:MAG TPA: methylenetetrahydrofolate reductase [Alphaproteobacteria bacterium]|jgi:methylenetetrahydrofolate reductase (NADPH)
MSLKQGAAAAVTAGPGGLERVLRAGHFAMTAEVTPPLSSNPARLLEKALPLKGYADAVNVTDGASARAHMSSLAASAILVQNGIEPILQVTCRDRNRIAIQSDLLGAGALGVRNVLVLTGDDPKAGDQPDTKPVFDLNSTALIKTAATMRDEGKLPSGREILDPPQLFIGAADLPIDPPAGWKAEGLKAKADAGARFVQTQFCFDMEIVRRYAAALRDLGLTERLYILIGIGPLSSAKSARWMRQNLYGTTIPDAIIDRMEQAKDPKAEGTRICVELLQQLVEIPGIAGAHLMAPLNEAAVPAAIEQSGLLKRRG